MRSILSVIGMTPDDLRKLLRPAPKTWLGYLASTARGTRFAPFC